MWMVLPASQTVCKADVYGLTTAGARHHGVGRELERRATVTPYKAPRWP